LSHWPIARDFRHLIAIPNERRRLIGMLDPEHSRRWSAAAAGTL
jgi:hypothetical protein